MIKQLRLPMNDAVGYAPDFAKKYAGKMVKNNQLNWYSDGSGRLPPWVGEVVGRVVGYTDFNDWSKVLVEIVPAARGYNERDGKGDAGLVFVIDDPPKRFAELDPVILAPAGE